MSSDNFVFNPKRWIKETTEGLPDETILTLDERYINVGENVLDQSINNLYLQHLNMETNGYIYFNGDNTTQTTAYDPNFVINQINLFLTKNNTFTGINKFRDLRIENTTNKITEFIQDDDNFIIRNNQNNGFIYLMSKGSDGVYRNIIIRENHISNLASLTSSLIYSQRIIFPGTQSIETNTNNDLLISNLISNKSIQLRTRNSTNTGNNTLVYDTNGNLSGLNNLTITTNLITPKIQFPSTDVSIFRSGLDLFIDNKILSGVVKINCYAADGRTFQISINEFANIGGVNDMSANRFILRTSSSAFSTRIQKSSNNELIIDNGEANSQILLRNYDTSNVMRQITISSIMNVSGINDLYVQRVFFNNVEFNPSTVTNLINKTTQIDYINDTPTSTPHTRFTIGPNQGVYIIPKIQAAKNGWNGTIQTGDNCLVSDNGSFSISTSSTTKVGVRITQTETELYNAKVIDGGLKFSDNTVQTTAMTQNYLNSLINTAVQNAMNNIVPVGTIFTYGGAYFNNLLQIIDPPTGYLWCFGGLISQSSYSALFNALGHSFSYGRVVPTGNFYLPDLKGAILKGCGFNDRFIFQTSGTTVGEIQQCNVGAHSHTYKDRGSGERNDYGSSGTSKVARATDAMFWTDGASYDVYTQQPLDSDTRPNSVCINYIIKF